ncbi:hypothetical protein [Amphritea sp. HPY]|uniref:hypothetical protein n=1 Tax=Amphritea sp. HPY TaxID=3421652 RepID=UPI003D7D1DCF
MKQLIHPLLFSALLYTGAALAGDWQWISLDLAANENRLTPRPAEVVSQGASTTIVLTNESPTQPTIFTCEAGDAALTCTSNAGGQYAGYTRKGRSICSRREPRPEKEPPKETDSRVRNPFAGIGRCVEWAEPIRSFIVLYRDNTMILLQD